MSSIMRCRSGLMALSVIGDAPVLMEVVETPSQDRTPRGAILFAVPPAAANYRASGLVLCTHSGQMSAFGCEAERLCLIRALSVVTACRHQIAPTHLNACLQVIVILIALLA